MKSPFFSGKQAAPSRPRNKAINATNEEGCCPCSRQHLSPRQTEPPGQKTGNQYIKTHATKQERSLVEAIVLQAAEDMWDSTHKKESILFFTGEGFATCARILWTGGPQKFRLLRLLNHALHREAPFTSLLPSEDRIEQRDGFAQKT